MTKAANSYQAGYGGSKVYASGDNTGLSLRGIIPHADAAVTNLEDGDANDILTEMGWGNGLIKGIYYPIDQSRVLGRINIDQAFVGYFA